MGPNAPAPRPGLAPLPLPLLAAVSLLLCALPASTATTNAHNTLPLPFTETFDSAALDSAWTTHLAKANAILVHDGVLELHSHTNAPACIERKLGADFIRVSCAIKPSTAGALGSLTVCWDPSNFIQIGLNRHGTDRLEARAVLGTYAHDDDLGPWTPEQWHFVALELGKDCIRFLTSADGKEFQCRHISRRPERFAKPPALLMLGRNPKVNIFPPPSPWIDRPWTETLNICGFRDLRVSPLDAGQLNASRAERKFLEREETDVFGEQELSAHADPTFESVCRHFPALKWSREVVGIKDHPVDIGVAVDGTLQFSADIARYGQPTAGFEIDGYRFGSGTAACSKRLLKGYLPVVIASDRRDGLAFEQSVFGYTKDFSPDEPLFAYARFRAKNTGDQPRNIKLRLLIEPASDKSPSKTWELSLPAHGSQAIAVRLPYEVRQSPASEISQDEFDSKLAETIVCWDNLIAQGSRFEIPEPRVQDAYRAWIAYNFLNVAKKGKVFEVCDGSGFYTQPYGYSVANYCNCLDLLGYRDLAALYFDSLLTHMQTNGLLAVNFGDTDTGVTLWAMSEHYRITRDADWLRRVAPKMLAMCRWITGQRAAALAQAATQPAVARGLIRYRPYADLLHPAADYFSNSYLRKGLAATAEVFAEIGLVEEAARLQQAADEYLKDITASMDAAVFTDRGLKILPAIPDTHELWKESDGSANGYYGIIAPCMLEAGLPAWNDPKATLLVNALERRGGLTVGIPRFHDLVDHAYAYGYWMNCLQRDQIKRAILGLYSSIAYGMSRGTYAAVECTAIRTGENYWTLPHTYSNTQQLRLLRNLLLREDNDNLWIGQAIPRPWLAPGNRVAVTAAPTLFGPVTFSIDAKPDGSMRVHLEPPTRSAPAEILVRLRHPDQRRIASVAGQGASPLKVVDDTLHLRQPTHPLDLDVRFK